MILVMGCTAGGKGKLAFELAGRLGGSIIGIDSMKVYRRMNIGTAKPGAEAREAIKHYLIDVAEPSEAFSLGRYVEMAEEAIAEIHGRDEGPIIAVGGTAMYIRGLLEGIFAGPAANKKLRQQLQQQIDENGLDELYQRLMAVDPAAAQRIHRNDAKRIIRAIEVYEATGEPISSFQRQFRSGNYRYEWHLVGLRREKEDNNHRINQRVKRMVDDGLVDEVKSLLAEPEGLSPQASQAVGYAEIISYLAGEITLEEAVEKIKINTRRFSKSQRTWFRSFVGVNWFDVAADDTVKSLADRVMAELERRF